MDLVILLVIGTPIWVANPMEIMKPTYRNFKMDPSFGFYCVAYNNALTSCVL